MKEKYQQYKDTMQKVADIDFSIALLSWDQEVNMPANGSHFRSQQMATLSGISHEISTDQKLGDLLKALNEHKDQLDEKQRKNVMLSLEDFEKKTKYPKEFVIRKSKVTSTAYNAWVAARKVNDFKVYQEALQAMYDLKKEESALLGYENHPYDAHLNEFEKGATVAELDILFKDVREQLVDFVKDLMSNPQVENSFLYKFYQKDKQWSYGLEVLKNMGYDFESGRQDISHHPFTTNFSPQDVRVTTRIDEHDFGNMTWSCIHEGGHALYEQGLPTEEYGLPLGSYISLGIHESQSRLWENNVGRSLPYWKAHYANLQKTFPENLGSVDLNKFYQGINKIEPNLIRTEADELHYHFHVMIRYEIEKGIFDGTIQVKDLSQVWNEMYKKYLNIEVIDDNNGVLQDIHWSHGLIGYFPTYSLGSFYAAQFFHQAQQDIPELITQIENGDNSELLKWLKEKIHRHGKFYTASELCKHITEESLNLKYFMDYAKEKYHSIYEPNLTIS